MATEEVLRSISLKADSSIGIYTGVPGLPGSASPNSGKTYRYVKVTGVGIAGLATAAANEQPIGVLQNKPQGVGHPATVAIEGVSKVECAAACTAGNVLKVDSTGRVTPATPGTDASTLFVGIALSTTANAGELCTVLIKLH